MLVVAVLACLACCVCAQETSTPTITAAPSPTNASADIDNAVAAETSVVSLFLPMGSPEQLQASVISASPDQIAFALGCGNNATTDGCGFNPPITLTEGESTIIWTNTHSGQDDVSYNIPPQTIECQLVGAHTSASPVEGATSAVCIARSDMSGLGIVASTSTLASSEINYMAVTVTAGVEKMRAASEAAATAEPETTTSEARAPAVTAMAKYGLGGALGIAVLGVI